MPKKYFLQSTFTLHLFPAQRVRLDSLKKFFPQVSIFTYYLILNFFMEPEDSLPVGGQDLIEGVMMKSNRIISIAVRTRKDIILIREAYQSMASKDSLAFPSPEV